VAVSAGALALVAVAAGVEEVSAELLSEEPQPESMAAMVNVATVLIIETRYRVFTNSLCLLRRLPYT
jgi:hypothetical protein